MIAGQRMHRVLVLDASLSMGYTSGDVEPVRPGQGRGGPAGQGTRAGRLPSASILMGQPPRVVIGDPSHNLKEVEKEIGELAITHGGADLAATFEAVDRVLDASSIGQKEVDLPDRPAGRELAAAARRRPTGSSGSWPGSRRGEPRSVLIDLGKSGGENRAVTDLTLDVPVVTVGGDVLVRGVVRNFGGSRVDGVRARLTVDGRLGPGGHRSTCRPARIIPVVFRQQFIDPGRSCGRAVRSTTTRSTLDNRRWLVVPVRESLNVLLVDGHFKSEPYQAETDYLAQALRPTESSPGSAASRSRSRSSPSRSSRGASWRPYDVVVLCNVAPVQPSPR